MTSPKSETMWMAWHKTDGWVPSIYSKSFLTCCLEMKIKHKDWEGNMEVFPVTIQPKKRGKG
jgi:hypothetical protein